MSRSNKGNQWPRKAKAADRKLEHARRRAQLKEQLRRHPDSAQNTERRYERWDQWSYD